MSEIEKSDYYKRKYELLEEAIGFVPPTFQKEIWHRAAGYAGGKTPSYRPVETTEKMAIAGFTPRQAKSLDDKELITFHNRLHNIWDKGDDFNTEDIANAHLFAIRELKRRKVDFECSGELEEQLQKNQPDVGDVHVPGLKWLRKENVMVIPDYVSIVGSSVQGEETDIDIVIRQEKRDESLEVAIRKVLDPDKKKEIHYIYNATGPHADYIPIFNLELVPKESGVMSIKSGQPIMLDLGCGENKPKGYLGIDKENYSDVDIVYDLENGIPMGDNSVDKVRANHFLEHIGNSVKIMDEIWRVLKPDCELEFEVPSTKGEGAFADPSHKSYWNKLSFNFFSQDDLRKEIGTKAKFDIAELKEENNPQFDTVYLKGILRAKKEIEKAELKPFGKFVPPKPVMAGLTDAFNVEQVWSWVKERL